MCAAVHRMTAFHVCCDPSQRQMDVPWSRSLLHCAWVWWNKCTVYVTPFFCPLPQDYRRWLTRLATYLSNSMRNKPGPSKLVLCSFTACNARAACHNHTHTQAKHTAHTIMAVRHATGVETFAGNTIRTRAGLGAGGRCVCECKAAAIFNAGFPAEELVPVQSSSLSMGQHHATIRIETVATTHQISISFSCVSTKTHSSQE